MDAEEHKLALASLITAQNMREAGQVIDRFPVLRDMQMDGLLTRLIQEAPGMELRDQYLAARAFLAKYRAGERWQYGQGFPCPPLDRACHLHEMVDPNCRVSLEEYQRWAKELLSILRPETEENIRGVVLFLLGQRLANSSSGLGGSTNLQEAEKCAWEAIAIFINKLAQAAAWQECLHLLDRIWTTYAWLDPPQYFDTTIQKYRDLLKDPRLDREPYEKALLLHSVASLYYRHPNARPPEFLEQGIDSLVDALMLLGNQSEEKSEGKSEKKFDLGHIASLDEKRQQQSARSLSQLGNAYLHRKRGEQLENIQRAVKYYQMALQVTGGPDGVERQADTLYNLSIAYGSWAVKAPKDRSRLLDEGLKSGEKALEILNSIPSSTLKQAKINIELGVLCSRYLDERGERRIDLLEEAMAYFQSACSQLNPVQNPFEWGNAHTHLGNAYFERARLSPVKAIFDLDQALTHYLEALKYHTRSRYPERWGNIQNNLGAVYSARNMRDLARASFQNTITVGKPGVLNEDLRRSAMNLGNMEFIDQNWKAAAEAYQIALEAGEVLYRASITQSGKKAELSENVALYQRAAYTMAKLGDPDRALVLLENGKTRILNELIQLQRAEQRPENVTDNLWNAFQDAKSLIQNSHMDTQEADGDAFAYTRRIAEQEAALEAFNTAVSGIQALAPGFLREVTLTEIRSIIPDAGTALVAFCMTEHGGYALILSRTGKNVQSIELSALTPRWVNHWLYGEPLKESAQQPARTGLGRPPEPLPESWLHACNAVTQGDETEINLAVMDQLLEEIGVVLVEPVLDRLPEGIRSLMILPTGKLFLVPFQAACLPGRGRRLLDLYPVSYLPSAKVLHSQQQPPDGAQPRKLYGILGPQPPADRSWLAVAFGGAMRIALKRLNLPSRPPRWEPIQLVEGAGCTEAAMLEGARGAAALHFYGHGHFNASAPLESCLYLAGGQELSLKRLQEGGADLSSIRLLTMTACEAGQVDTSELPEEYVSLPAGFMQAGIPCVVSPLWPAHQISGTLLMQAFYRYYTQGCPPPAALQAAQQEIRGLTRKDLVERSLFADDEVRRECKAAENSGGWYRWTDPDDRPFAHPFYWAAFTVNGAAENSLFSLELDEPG